jgi:glycosyltransferase involved in cell wall biosynthesis
MSEGLAASVIMPMYKAEGRITHALESILSQGREDVEIICVDDCSPDRSAEEVALLQKSYPQIHLIRNTTNRGPGASTNRGIEQAQGEYVVIVHSDDILLPGALTALIDHTRAHPSDLVLLGCEELRRNQVKPMTSGPLVDYLTSQPAVVTAYSHPRVLFWPPGPWSKVYRRKFLLDTGLRFPDGVFEDIPWSVHTTVNAQTISVLPEPQYRYVTSTADSSITTSLTERNLDRINQVRLIREGLDLDSLSPELLTHISALVAIHLVWANRASYKTLPPETHESFFYDSAEILRWWHERAPVPPWLDSRPLMPAMQRDLYSRALRSGDWRHWLSTLERQKTMRRFRGFFRPGRVFGKRT